MRRRSSAKGRGRTRLWLEELESRTTPTVITVTTALDVIAADGEVSLREAIQAANTDKAVHEAPAGQAGTADKIVFDIPGAGPHVIDLVRTLPAITEAVFIDGFTEPGAPAGTISIILDGSNAGPSTNGLILRNHTGSTLEGLEVRDFGGTGVLLVGGGGHTVDKNLIGVDADGTARGNAIGVLVATNSTANTIGTLAFGAGNVISGNRGDGVRVNGNENTVQGNFIGVNNDGNAALPNHGSGVVLNGANNQVLGTFQAGSRQVISGNRRNGVRIAGSDNLVKRNIIG